MKIAILGLAQTGKKTLFTLLTGRTVPATRKPGEVVEGVAPIHDSRVDALSALLQAEKDHLCREPVRPLPRHHRQQHGAPVDGPGAALRPALRADPGLRLTGCLSPLRFGGPGARPGHDRGRADPGRHAAGGDAPAAPRQGEEGRPDHGPGPRGRGPATLQRRARTGAVPLQRGADARRGAGDQRASIS